MVYCEGRRGEVEEGGERLGCYWVIDEGGER